MCWMGTGAVRDCTVVNAVSSGFDCVRWWFVAPCGRRGVQCERLKVLWLQVSVNFLILSGPCGRLDVCLEKHSSAKSFEGCVRVFQVTWTCLTNRFLFFGVRAFQ